MSDRFLHYRSFLSDLKTDRSLWFIIYFAILLAYLLLNQGGSIDLTRAPQWAFRAFAFGGLVIFGLLDGRRIRESLSNVNLLAVLPISIFIMLVSSNIVSIRPIETVEETMNILAYASLAFLCYTYIDSLKRLRQLIEVLLVAGFLIAFHGLFIFYGALWSRGETTPLSSFFYWHNPCAGFLLLIWPVMLAQFYSLRRGWHTFLILYIFYITFTAFGLTLSRGGWLSGMIPFLLIPFFLSRKKVMVGWRPLALIGLYFLSAIPFVLRYRGRFFQPIIDRWNQMRPDDYSVVGRFEFWDIAIRVFKEHPWLGIGFNTFGYYYVHFQTDPQYYTKDPHSLYLRFLVEGGVVGVVVIAAILWIVLRLVIKTLKADRGKMLTVYRIGLLGGIVGELGHMALDFDWTFPVIPMLLVCQIAIVARTFTYPEAEQELSIEKWEPYYKDYEDVADNASTDGHNKKGWYLKSRGVWLTVAIVLFFANTSGYVSMNLYEKGKDLVDQQAMLASERAEEQMSQLEREAFRSQTQEEPDFGILYSEAQADIVQEGMRLWQGSLRFNPWNWYPLKDLLSAHYYGAADLYQSGADLDLEKIVDPGLEYGYRLLRITPHRPATHFFVGQMEVLAGRLKSDDDLKQLGFERMLHAIELDPVNIPSYYLAIAQYYYYDLQDTEQALDNLGRMVEIFVPRFDNGDIDFNGLKGKSGARLDWQFLTMTMRDSWKLTAEILIGLDRKEDALLPLYNAFSTVPGAGEREQARREIMLDPETETEIILSIAPNFNELVEGSDEWFEVRPAIREALQREKEDRFYRRLQIPILLRIAELSRDLEDWTNMHRRAQQLVEILVDLGISGTPESIAAWDLYYTAQGHLRELNLLDDVNSQDDTPDE